MIDDQYNLLARFDVRIRDLMRLCDEHKQSINELTKLLNQKEEELHHAKQTIDQLNSKCGNLLTARVVSVDEGDMKSARNRLSKLVREVDKCIALLNE